MRAHGLATWAWLAGVAMMACGDEPPPGSHSTPLASEEDAGGAPSSPPSSPEACAPFERAPEGALDALERLKAARRAAGIAPEVDLDVSPQNVVDALDTLGELDIAPGFGMDGLILRRGCRGQLRYIHGTPYLTSVGPEGEADPESRCEAFLSEWGALWGMGHDPGMRLEHERTKLDDKGGAHCVYQQTYHGVGVDVHRLVVHLDREGRVTGANGEYLLNIEDPPDPTVPAADAYEAAQASAPHLSPEEPALVVHAPRGAEPRVAWRVVRLDSRGMNWDVVWISAVTGDTLGRESLVRQSHGVIRVHDGQWGGDSILRYQSDPPVNEQCNPNNPDCMQVRDNLYLTMDMWDQLFGRDSWDDDGGTLSAVYDVIDVPCGYAGTAGGGAMNLSPGITDLELICHEAGHSMEVEEVGLRASGNYHSAILGEHHADMHALWCDHTFGQQTWALQYCENDPTGMGPYQRRSFSDPPGNPETPGGETGFHEHAGPDSWRWFEERPWNDPPEFELPGHRNAGILNKLAYLLHRTGTEAHHGVEVEGLGLDVAKWIFYDVIADAIVPSDGDIHDYRDALQAACANRWGGQSHECEQLDEALHAVGLWSPPQTVTAHSAARPSAQMAPWSGNDLLAVMYPHPWGFIMWRWVLPSLGGGAWLDEEVVQVNGQYPLTDRPVAMTRSGNYLYVFYKHANDHSIRYFRMSSASGFEGIWTIPTELAETDRAPAAATHWGMHTVMFNRPGVSTTGHVRRPVSLPDWELGPTPPLWFGMDGDPYLTTDGAWFVLSYRDSLDALWYVYHLGDAWYTYDEPPSTDTSPWSRPVSKGHRQYAIGAESEWDYDTPASDQGPTIASWKGGLAYAHKEEGSNSLRMSALAEPRFSDHPGRVWTPSVEQPDASDTAPLVVRVNNPDGSERGLWLITRGDHETLRWREMRGGQ